MMLYRYLSLTAAIIFICFTLSDSKPASTAKNHELLKKLGLQKIRGPNSHHRKRLAVESRHNSRSDDSHMFIVKLPPNPHYYVHNKPNTIEDIHSQSKNLPVGFKNNGKPAKIYHWNMPLLKKIVSKHPKSKFNEYSANFGHSERWNDVLDKPERDRKPHKPSYYVPAKTKKSGFTKYFPGNGKPHSFYVIEKSRKAHYHRLLP
ncbi:uncharacterized protein [Leptinotarsa decemlineata]|uniref:uncharacterized protein n=1 Tax=Leptinotarsa decemlineata TaxID=7539 RepID=UPI003D30CD36